MIMRIPLFLVLFAGAVMAQEAPKITVVTGPDAPALEKKAAGQLAEWFKPLFGAETTITTEVPAKADHLILLGSPATNPAVKTWIGDGWPADLDEEGFVVKTVAKDGREALVVGGKVPSGTFGAASELAHHFGIRCLANRDYFPLDKPQLKLGGIDIRTEEVTFAPCWRITPRGPASQESWGIEEHRRFIGQLAKMRFGRVELQVKGDGAFWEPTAFPVGGDTPGRSVFAGAKYFENPALAGKTNPEERTQAGSALTKEILAAARDYGMEVVLVHPDQPGLEAALAAAYPDVERIVWKEASKPASILPFPDGTNRHAAYHSTHRFLSAPLPNEGGYDLYSFSRIALDPGNPENRADAMMGKLLTPICGDGVDERVLKAFEAGEAAGKLIAENDPAFAQTAPDMFMRHFNSSDPAPAWWAEVTTQFGNATNEMYRANTRARDGARPYLLYHAKRFNFALQYMLAVTSARAAGVARANKDADAEVAAIEAALEALHSGLGTYAEVAQDNSDRGVIAVVNNHAYQPLLKALDEMPVE